MMITIVVMIIIVNDGDSDNTDIMMIVSTSHKMLKQIACIEYNISS